MSQTMQKKQMRLQNFCEEYDIPYQVAFQWIHSKNFPAYKLGGRWYVDIQGFLDWREQQKENKAS